jgi:DNA-binding IclR family transcriptional regulator
MSERTPDGMKGEPQVLDADELAVYEAIATPRRPMDTDELVRTTGLPEATVHTALDRLAELDMIDTSDKGATLGRNSWDVRGRNYDESDNRRP